MSKRTAVKRLLGYDEKQTDREVLRNWKSSSRRVCKPCWELRYCPYGPLVEQSPLLPAIRKDAIAHDEYLRECLRTNRLAGGAPVTAQKVKGGAPVIEPSWQTGLMRQLQRYKRYPASAHVHKEEGVVLLSFTLDRAGHVLAHSIARSSGYPDLDQSVDEMMRGATLPPFPTGMSQREMQVSVTIRFSLRR